MIAPTIPDVLRRRTGSPPDATPRWPQNPAMTTAGVQRALTELTNGLEGTAKDRRIAAEAPVEQICSAAYRQGLSEGSLSGVIEFVIRDRVLRGTAVERLVENLFPAEAVSDDVVIKVVVGLGQGAGKATPWVQRHLLRWLIIVYEVLEHRAVLSTLYGTLFNLLDMLSLRDWLCQLLAIITRRRHVRPFRIQALLALLRTAGNEPALLRLIHVYNDHAPNLVSAAGISGKPAAFSHPDVEWRAHLLALRDPDNSRTEGVNETDTQFRIVRRGAKRGKVDFQPYMSASLSSKSPCLDDLDKVDELVKNLERLELPSQTMSALRDSVTQKYLSLRPSDKVAKRIHHWLRNFFDDTLESARSGKGHVEELPHVLQAVLKYSQSTKMLPPACERFLEHYLSDWDGLQCRKAILGLLAHVPMRPFEELQLRFLDPLEVALLDDTASSKAVVLNVYTTILHNWIVHVAEDDVKASTQGQSATVPLPDYARFVKYTDTLCLSLLESADNPSIASLSAVLSFYELLATSHDLAGPKTGHQWSFILPSSFVVYHCLLAPSPSIVSRLCSLVVAYKRAFDKLDGPRPSKLQFAATNSYRGAKPIGIPPATVNQFKHILQTVQNCVLLDKEPSPNLNSTPVPIRQATISRLSSHAKTLDSDLLSSLSPLLSGSSSSSSSFSSPSISSSSQSLSSFFKIPCLPAFISLAQQYLRDDRTTQQQQYQQQQEQQQQQLSGHNNRTDTASSSQTKDVGALDLETGVTHAAFLAWLAQRGFVGLQQLHGVQP